MAETALRLSHISKHFGALKALDDVSIELNAGEVHAVLGQNGSGKSTLVKVIAGYHTPEPGGRLELWGRETEMPIKAPYQQGLAVIHQDLAVVETLSVFDNICVSARYSTGVFAPISRREERARCASVLQQAGLTLNLDRPAAELSSAERAGVAIARAIRVLEQYGDRFVFILDEPTTYLSAEEADRVMALMRRVADAGSAVVFISHRLAEVAAVADRVTVLRDGRVADSFAASEGQHDRIVTAMLGRSLDRYYPDPPAVPVAAPRVRADRLEGERLSGVSFEIRAGEIVGFTGLVGMGHEEIPYLLAGAAPVRGGMIEVDDHEITRVPLRQRMKQGIVLVPGNRQRDGVWLSATAQENATLPMLVAGRSLQHLRIRAERRRVADLMTTFGVRPPDPSRRLNQFSGGNQQKIVLAKWMASDPGVLLLDEPTQGVDAGAKFEILQMIVSLAERGAAVVVASGDYEQLANICTRVVVIRDGSTVGELAGVELTEEMLALTAQMGGVYTSTQGVL